MYKRDKRAMPDQEAILRGKNFERELADRLSGQLQPGSGNKFFAKSDVVSNGLIISAKSELNLSWPKIYKHLLEAIELAYGTGDIPVLALEDADRNNDQIIVMRLSDFTKVFEDDIKFSNNCSSKGLEKRKTAEIPLMMR